MKISYGFTLIEIAVVLVILGLLVSSLLAPISEQITQKKQKVTQQRLEEINEALLGFAINNGYLPCPAQDENGKAADYENLLTENKCKEYDNSAGYLPWADLGVTGYDGWGRPFFYRVDGYFSNAAGFPNPPDVLDRKDCKGRRDYNELCNSVTDEDSVKDLVITNKADEILNAVIDNTEKKPAKIADIKKFINHSNVVAIIFSCGKNGQADSYNYRVIPCPINNVHTLEWEEQNPTMDKDWERYIQDTYIENQFDDELVWLSKNILINHLVAAEKWHSQQ